MQNTRLCVRFKNPDRYYTEPLFVVSVFVLVEADQLHYHAVSASGVGLVCRTDLQMKFKCSLQIRMVLSIRLSKWSLSGCSLPTNVHTYVGKHVCTYVCMCGFACLHRYAPILVTLCLLAETMGLLYRQHTQISLI